MHKIILKLFDFLRSCTQFIKILLVFSIMMLILYWIQDLTSSSWDWFVFFVPIFDLLVTLGGKIFSGTITIFSAVFEFKYMGALLIIFTLYALDHFVFISLGGIEELYKDGRRIVRKFEEKRFNESLEKQNTAEQKKLKRYHIFVNTFVKSKYTGREFNIDMNEQNQLMNKFLIEKTGISPQKCEEGGFIYTFESFEHIDEMLDVFSKLPESKTPIDYIICVQVLGADFRQEVLQLKELIGLKMLNKITTLSDTAYRYSFNKNQKYSLSQLGVFQKPNGTFEVHQFVRKNILIK